MTLVAGFLPLHVKWDEFLALGFNPDSPQSYRYLRMKQQMSSLSIPPSTLSLPTCFLSISSLSPCSLSFSLHSSSLYVCVYLSSTLKKNHFVSMGIH